MNWEREHQELDGTLKARVSELDLIFGSPTGLWRVECHNQRLLSSMQARPPGNGTHVRTGPKNACIPRGVHTRLVGGDPVAIIADQFSYAAGFWLKYL